MNGADMIDLTAASALPDRSDELFRFFARFEYALKERGYGRARHNGKVEANWDCFANEQLTSNFYEHVRNRELAHGGKSGEQDSDRDDLLVEEAIKILAEALLAHPDLRAMFEGKW